MGVVSQPVETVEKRLLAKGLEALFTPERRWWIMNMMGWQVAQGALFYGFWLDDHVPADHLLRRIVGLLDFGFVRGALAASYSTSGRSSIDPELMLRMLLVCYLSGIRSERRLCCG